LKDFETKSRVRKYESGMGLPHSKTLARSKARRNFREVLECGSPMPFFVPTSSQRWCATYERRKQ